jgi:hypothetical protein
MKLRRKAISASDGQERVRYGHWLHVKLASGEGFWIWQPAKQKH